MKLTDTWQLIITTGTTIVTFLMVFLIQRTQKRNARTVNLKLDDLIRADKHTRNHLSELEDLSDDELDKAHRELCELQRDTEERIAHVRKHRNQRANRGSEPQTARPQKLN